MKKILVVLIVLSMTLGLLAGCASEGATSAAPVSTAEQPTATSNESNGGSDEVEGNGDIGASGENLEDDVPEEVEDPFEILKTTWSFAEGQDGAAFLKKGDEIYNLISSKPYENKAKYLPGSTNIMYGHVMLYYTDRLTNQIISYGDLPVPTLEGDDTVIVFSSRTVPGVTLQALNYAGAAICFENELLVRNLETGEVMFSKKKEARDFSVSDESGEIVENMRNLKFGDSYIASWYTGTQYHELKTRAICHAYDFTDETYSFEGVVGKSGYAEYIISGIPSGIYYIYADAYVRLGGLIEIK